MDNLDKLKLLAEALLEFETVDGAEIDTIFAGGRLDRKPSSWAIGASKIVDKAKADKAAAEKRAPEHLRAAAPAPDKA